MPVPTGWAGPQTNLGFLAPISPGYYSANDPFWQNMSQRTGQDLRDYMRLPGYGVAPQPGDPGYDTYYTPVESSPGSNEWYSPADIASGGSPIGLTPEAVARRQQEAEAHTRQTRILGSLMIGGAAALGAGAGAAGGTASGLQGSATVSGSNAFAGAAGAGAGGSAGGALAAAPGAFGGGSSIGAGLGLGGASSAAGGAGAAAAGAGGGGGLFGGLMSGGGNWLQTGLSLGSQLLGSGMQARSEQNAAESMNPWNVNGLFGNAQFDPNSRTATANSDPMQAQLRALFGQNAQNMMGGGGNNPFLNFAQQTGNTGIPGLFGDMQSTLQNMPSGAFDQFNQQMQGAQGIANQDLQGLMASRLGLLRQQAAPQEQQQYNSLQNRLFGQGRLGSTGGGNEVQSFARGLGEADLSRQMQAQNLGLQAQQGNLQQAGMLSNLAGQGFQGALNYNDLGANRAGQRMQNAMSLFGFGNQLQGQQQQQGLQGLQGMLGIDQNQMNMMALGRNLSASPQQAAMGASNPWGSMLQGMGTSMGQNVDWSQLFSGGK